MDVHMFGLLPGIMVDGWLCHDSLHIAETPKKHIPLLKV